MKVCDQKPAEFLSINFDGCRLVDLDQNIAVRDVVVVWRLHAFKADGADFRRRIVGKCRYPRRPQHVTALLVSAVRELNPVSYLRLLQKIHATEIQEIVDVATRANQVADLIL